MTLVTQNQQRTPFFSSAIRDMDFGFLTAKIERNPI